MNKNIVFGMIASIALATAVLVAPPASAGGLRTGVEPLGPPPGAGGAVWPGPGPSRPEGPAVGRPDRPGPGYGSRPGRPGGSYDGGRRPGRPGSGYDNGYRPGRPGPGYRERPGHYRPGPGYYDTPRRGYYRDRPRAYYYDDSGAALGMLGALAIGGAIAAQNSRPAYECYTERQRFWDGYGWRVRRVEVCD